MCINVPAPKLVNSNIARNGQTPTEVKRKTMKNRMRLAGNVSQLVCNSEVLVFYQICTCAADVVLSFARAERLTRANLSS